ncbi:MAG: YihY/virulence factor BrkB family protein [Sediminibacterium sp.]|nr:YihY/virulence factor BrkB family protein [Sediminibacterium sp.]
MRRHIVSTWSIFKESFYDFLDNKAFRMSAALAYYTVFSLAPMLIVIISLCDIFYGRDAIEGTIFLHIQGFIGADAALQIEQVIRNAAISNDITWASVIGVCALIFAATGVFAEIQDSINFIWRLKAKPRKGWVKLILNRLLSFSMVVSLGFILLVSLVVNSVLDLVERQLLRLFPNLEIYLAYGINLLITFVTISSLFAIIFKVLPDARIEWRDVAIGSFTTAILFMFGKFAISYYLGKTHISTTYGAAGSVVIILLWVYYSASFLYYGASFTRVYAKRTGRNIYPNDYAVWIQEIELENKASLQVQENPVLTQTTLSVLEPKLDEPVSDPPPGNTETNK